MSAFHGSTRIARSPAGKRAPRSAVTGTPGRGSPLHSAVVEVRHMAGCLQHPCGAALSAAWRTGLRFVRIIVLGHLILTHRRQKTCAHCASQDETTDDCSTRNGKNQGLACRNLDWTILALLGEIWYRINAASGGKALTTNTGGCPLPVPECRVRRFSCRFVLPRTLKGGKGG